MYTEEDLKKYKYFKGADLNFVLDSLTGVISRQYILDFARTLIKNKTPFAMCMMDLDNFKYINDSYGHDAGDKCLATVAENLRKCTGNEGLVGRFGGDEFVIIYMKSNQYDDVHHFFEKMYDDPKEGAVRRSIYIDKIRTFITATIGSASYPIDAEDYNELFLKMDKALYRGKSKGRNCYIIYVHEKHKDIVVNERGTNSLLSKTQDLQRIVATQPKEMLVASMADYLYRTLHPKDLLYVRSDNVVRSAHESKDYNYGKNAYFMLTKIMGDKDIFPSSNPQDIKERFPETEEIMTVNRIHAFVLAKVGDHGIIILYENNITRMWQDYDLVLLSYASILLKFNLEK